MADPQFAGPDHGEIVAEALREFREALTRRWREKVCDEVVRGHHDFPIVIRREVSPHTYRPVWAYWSSPAREHLRFPGQCKYVEWAESGQNGSLESVDCDGATGMPEDVPVPGPHGELVVVPPYIECGMGSVLAQVEEWARGECDHLLDRLPMFDHHDVRRLMRAHDALVDVGCKLVLKPADGSDTSGVDFSPSSADDLENIVGEIATGRGADSHWWAGWTGLAADRARSNFFDSVGPTIENQSGLAGSLANLYSDRAAIIIEARNNTIRSIQTATEALGGKVTTPRANDWKIVQDIGAGITSGFGWNVKGAALGAVVFLVGFLGRNLDTGTRTVGYAQDFAEVVAQLNDEIDEVSAKVDSNEWDYLIAASRLRRNLFEIHSFELELYDLTQNDADGDRDELGLSDDGFSAVIGDVLKIAAGCYKAGNRYGELPPIIDATSEADRHMAGKDGTATGADRIVLELRDQLAGFLETTCGRYLVAGEQVRQAAEAYVAVDESQAEAFEQFMEEWDWPGGGVAAYDPSIDPEEYAAETDRGDYDPYEGHPALGGGSRPGANSDVAPGSGTDVEYVIEGNDEPRR